MPQIERRDSLSIYRYLSIYIWINKPYKEIELFDKLEKSLSTEQFANFQDFLMAYADRYSDYQEYAFKQGVKVGFELANEIKNITI